MSRPGPGYSRGRLSADAPNSTLFGERGGGDSPGDFYDSLNPGASPSPYGPREQGLNTVFEQEEPASSPDMNRSGQQWSGHSQEQYGGERGGYYGQQQQGQQRQQGAYGGYDSLAQGYGQHQRYDQQTYSADSSQQAVDAPYYPGWIWDAASGQYLPDTNHGGESEQYGAASAEQAQADHNSQAQQQSQAVDAPYYPGWVWDAASGQYLPDSNYDGEGGQQGESTAADQGHAADGAEQNGYAQGDSEQQYDSYGHQYGRANSSQTYPAASLNQHVQADPYSTHSQPSPASHDQNEHEARQPAAFDAQDEEDPYANDPYNAESYAQYGQGGDSYAQQQQDSHDPYGREQQGAPFGQHEQQVQTLEQEDPYAADSNPYADESAGGDPFAQSDSQDPFARQQSYDTFGTRDQQQQASNQSFDPYAPRQEAPPHSQQPQQRAPPQQEPQRQEPQRQQPPSSKQQEAFDPYAPTTSRAAPPPIAPSQPLEPSQNRAAYSPPPPQQQFTSFGAAFDAPPQRNEPARSTPYVAHAPPTRQAAPLQQQQPREAPRQDPQQPEELPHDPYAPRKSQGKSQNRQPREQRPYDPYNLQSSQSSQGPASPPMRHQPFPQTGSSAASAGRAALSPPPRSASAASNASSRQASAPAQAGPPPQSGAQQPPQTAALPPRKGPESVASPRSEASFNLASPPSRARELPQQQQRQQQQSQQRQAPPKKQQSAAPAFDLPPPRSAPAARLPQQAAFEEPPASDTPADSAARPATAPQTTAPYAPPPAAPNRDSYAPPSQPVLPPSQRKPPSISGGLMRPPVPRAPHQRGASAFGSDSPYGALPSGPPTAAYEPPQTVEQIKEEEEEEEVPPEQKESEKPEEFVPSWMQATSKAPPPPVFPNKPRDQPVKQEQEEGSRVAPPPQRQPVSKPSTRSQQLHQQQRDPVDDLNEMSLDERPSQLPSQHAPLPPRNRARPPPTQQQTAPPPPRDVAKPPPGTGGAPPLRGPVAARPPPSAQQQPQQQQRPPPQNQQPPQRGPPRAKPSLQMPLSPERSQVPQLQFEAPSPEVRAERRGERYDYGGGRLTPVPTMSGIEETPEPREGDEDDYFGRSDTQQTDSQYGMDDSTVFTTGDGDRATGPTTPSSQYGGDWRADSQDAQGYDYLGHPPAQHQQQQQKKPYGPYAPATQRDLYPHRDVPSRDLAVTPPAQQRGPTIYASPDKRAVPPRQALTASAMARASSYDAPPSRKTSTDSYGYDQQQENSYAPPAAQQSQRQSYNPYAGAAAQVQRPASMGNGEPADLGLERRRAPVVSFGFGGRMVVVFPDGGRPDFGGDSSNPYGAPSTNSQLASPSVAHVRKLADIVPPPADGNAFPGPIFLDGGKANAGKKRKEALSWLAQRMGELEQEVSYARGAAPSVFEATHADERRRKVESRLMLVKLVKVMVENEGKLTGSPKVDDAVRAIFTGEPTNADPGAAALPTADQLVAASSRMTSNASTAPFITYGVSPADLDQMSEYLLRGERREAVRHALDHKMWAHAFIIASCVDTDCWKEVTIEFLRTELTPSAENPAPGAEGREALRVAYGMFAGLGAESMHQFIPPQALGSGTSALRNGAEFDNGAASTSHSPTSQERRSLAPSTLAKWQETVGMIVANRTAGDSAALTSLGDGLAANGWTDAAHVCYLLSPQTSLTQGLGMPTSRIVLVGSSPLTADATIDLESVKLTELVEFAFSLVPAVKGHDAFVGFPHLQAFRLYHAAVLADSGNISQAHRYAEAVVNTLKLATKPSPFYHPRLVAQIKSLSERLGAAPGQKEGGSWLARKVPRPTVNSLWSTFEGGFNKFVAGDEQPTAQQLAARAEVAKQANGAAVGAFSHFSSIAPGSTSGTLSHAQTSYEQTGSNRLHAYMLAQHASSRPTSPLATAPHPQAHHHQSPGPPPVKRAAFKTHHARSSSLGAFAGYEYSPNVAPPWQSYTPPSLPGRGAGNAERLEGREHEQSPPSPRGPPSARRPQFASVEEQLQEDESGFISPMAQFGPSVSPSTAAASHQQQQQQTHRRMTTAEELADLGIANSKSKKPAFDTLDEELEAEEGGMPQEKRPNPEENGSGAATPATAGSGPKLDDKPTIKPSKSWLGGWFKREASPANAGPGPVKANLGEQKSFVYDEKLKRWVNKSSKGGDESPATVTPPPRAATASPSKALRNGPPRFMSETPPVPPMPTRAATNPPPLARSATSGDLRGDTRPSSAASNPTRPPSAAGMPPRTTGTPGEGGSTRSSAKRKPKYAVYAP
ncbi:COPII vesicle coat protein Sec16 [Rhodotorula toruloides]|uniref:Protein transport protein sec16 n=1 Tax=Rhodotorula toruloides TaxID=5286 RepID=A0A511KHS2_RHOTO|nr:COPII vesicle coat protein Sec16 [Rhodotorula toruloides]